MPLLIGIQARDQVLKRTNYVAYGTVTYSRTMGRCLIVQFSLGLVMYEERQNEVLTEERRETNPSSPC